jgi:hypothetical protein
MEHEMGLNMVRRSSMTCVLACAPFLCSCNFLHDGRKAFLASQKKATQTKHFMVELDEPVQMAYVKRSQALDCDARYFHEHEVLERTPQGIETGASLFPGPPEQPSGERDAVPE